MKSRVAALASIFALGCVCTGRGATTAVRGNNTDPAIPGSPTNRSSPSDPTDPSGPSTPSDRTTTSLLEITTTELRDATSNTSAVGVQLLKNNVTTIL